MALVFKSYGYFINGGILHIDNSIGGVHWEGSAINRATPYSFHQKPLNENS